MKAKRALGAATSALTIVGLVAASPATARNRHRHHARPATAQAADTSGAYAQFRDPAEFYPENIEGGVRGNLSFNNQIRKHTDPLNANGGGG